VPPVFRYAGFGNEAQFGTAVPAEFHVDMKSATLDAPSKVESYYAGGLSRGVRTRRPGYYRPAGNIVYAWDIRTIAAMLRWALGGYVFTPGGSADLNTHEIYPSNDVILPSFTSRIGKDVFEHVFAGCVVDSLEIDFAAEFLMATMVVSAQKDSKAALAADEAVLLLPDEFPLAFHEATLALPDGSDRSADVKALKLSIANGLRADSGKGIGSRFPYRLPVGSRDVTLGCDLWYESTDDLEAFWGDATGPATDGSVDQALRIAASAGDDGSLDLLIPKAHFTKTATQPSGREEITLSTELRAQVDEIALADSGTTILGELLATVTNAADDQSGESA
jgi:hypothetical protein